MAMNVHYAHPRMSLGREEQKNVYFYRRFAYWHQKKDKTKRSNPGGISAAMGAPMAVGVRYAHRRLRGGRKEQKTALHKYISMRGLHTSIKRRKKQKWTNCAIFSL